jgi:molybdenum cofactor cytidylyltransferase
MARKAWEPQGGRDVRSTVSAIILAAGMSKRMGTLKQLARIGEKTLLESTISALQDSSVDETILVLGYRANEIQQAIPAQATTKIVINDAYEAGMSTSIRAGIRAVSSDSSAALIVLSDQPFLKVSIINTLIDAYRDSGAKILVPVYRGFRGNPVLIDRSLFSEMMEITGDIGCRSLFGLHSDQIRKVPVEDIGILIDIDSKEDLARFSTSATPTEETLDEADLEGRSLQNEQRHLLIVGSDEIASSLAKFAKILKFRVTVIDPLLNRSGFPETDVILNELNLTKANTNSNTYIVVASRGKFDEEALQQAVGTSAAYIALVGSKKRGAEIIQRLQIRNEARIYCPAGLEIQAESPEEIALSVIAQIVQLSRKKS